MKANNQKCFSSRSNFVLHAIIFMVAHVFLIVLASAMPIFCTGIIWVTPVWCTALLIHCLGCMIFNQKLFNAVLNA